MRSSVTVFLVCLISCGPRAPMPAADRARSDRLGDSLVLERTPCFGSCPAYRVRVTRGGQVRFESRNPRDSGRVGEASVDSIAVDALFHKAASLGLDSLPPRLMGRSP